MAKGIYSLLQTNYENLLGEYYFNQATLLALQKTLIDDILPYVADELELDASATIWAEKWLEDDGTRE